MNKVSIVLDVAMVNVSLMLNIAFRLDREKSLSIISKENCYVVQQLQKCIEKEYLSILPELPQNCSVAKKSPFLMVC